MCPLNAKLLGADLMKQLKCLINRHRDAIKIQQAETAVKRLLVKNVREGPETIAINETRRLPYDLSRLRPRMDWCGCDRADLKRCSTPCNRLSVLTPAVA